MDISLSKMATSSYAVGFQEVKTKKVCKECGNKLTILGRYNHPIQGKKHSICGACSSKLDKVIEQWRIFVFSHPKFIASLDIDGEMLKNNFEKTVSSIMKKYGFMCNTDN